MNIWKAVFSTRTFWKLILWEKEVKGIEKKKELKEDTEKMWSNWAASGTGGLDPQTLRVV